MPTLAVNGRHIFLSKFEKIAKSTINFPAKNFRLNFHLYLYLVIDDTNMETPKTPTNDSVDQPASTVAKRRRDDEVTPPSVKKQRQGLHKKQRDGRVFERGHKTLEWFVSYGLIIPVEQQPITEKNPSGYEHIWGIMHTTNATFLYGKYLNDEQDFFIGKELNGKYITVHWPTFQTFKTPTAAGVFFVDLHKNSHPLNRDSNSHYSGLQYLRFKHVSWKGLSFKPGVTLREVKSAIGMDRPPNCISVRDELTQRVTEIKLSDYDDTYKTNDEKKVVEPRVYSESTEVIEEGVVISEPVVFELEPMELTEEAIALLLANIPLDDFPASSNS